MFLQDGVWVLEKWQVHPHLAVGTIDVDASFNGSMLSGVLDRPCRSLAAHFALDAFGAVGAAKGYYVVDIVMVNEFPEL